MMKTVQSMTLVHRAMTDHLDVCRGPQLSLVCQGPRTIVVIIMHFAIDRASHLTPLTSEQKQKAPSKHSITQHNLYCIF